MTDFNWVNPQILLILAGNCLPNFEDTSKGMMRRLIYINFKNSLRDEQVDIYMGKKLCENQANLDCLFFLGRCLCGDAKRRGYLCELDESEEIKARYVESKKSEIELFKDYLDMECVGGLEEWLLGTAGLEEVKKGGMAEIIARTGRLR